MELEKVLQGNDVTMRKFTVKAGGAVIAPADMNDYEIYIYQVENKKKKPPVCVFKKTPNTAAGELQAVVVETEKIGFVIPRTKTKNLLGILYAEIKTKITADSNYISNLESVGGDEFKVCEIIESANKNGLAD